MDDSRRQEATQPYRIDPQRDHLVALADVAVWHEKRTGRRVHRSVPYSWAQHGIEGIRLPCIRFAGVRYTSTEALAWWISALSQGLVQ